MGAYVLLNFIDDIGRSRVAKIPVEYYQELLNRAQEFERSQNGRRSRFEEASYERPSYHPKDNQGPPPRAGSTWREGPQGYGPDFFQRLFNDFVNGDPYASYSEARGSTKTKTKTNPINRLYQLAGVDKPADTTQVPDLDKLLRKAKRKCHPDTGGNNELWLELEKIAKELGLKF